MWLVRPRFVARTVVVVDAQLIALSDILRCQCVPPIGRVKLIVMTAVVGPTVVEKHVVRGTVQFQEGAVRSRNGVHEHILLGLEVGQSFQKLVKVLHAGENRFPDVI